MKRNVSAEDEARIASLHERLILTIQFLEGVQDFPSAGALLAIVNAAADQNDLRSLRLLKKEVEAMSLTLQPHEMNELECLLKARLGISKEAERYHLHERVQTILKRGHIVSEKERKKIEEYVEMLEVVGDEYHEKEALNALLRRG